MSDIGGGIHVEVTIHLDHDELTKMPPAVVTALMAGIAQILSAQAWAREAAKPVGARVE